MNTSPYSSAVDPVWKQSYKTVIAQMNSNAYIARFTIIEDALRDMMWCIAERPRGMDREMIAVQVVYNQFRYADLGFVDEQDFLGLYRRVMRPFWFMRQIVL